MAKTRNPIPQPFKYRGGWRAQVTLSNGMRPHRDFETQSEAARWITDQLANRDTPHAMQLGGPKNATLSANQLQAMLGHKTMHMAQVYVNFAKSDVVQVLDDLADRMPVMEVPAPIETDAASAMNARRASRLVQAAEEQARKLREEHSNETVSELRPSADAGTEAIELPAEVPAPSEADGSSLMWPSLCSPVAEAEQGTPRPSATILDMPSRSGNRPTAGKRSKPDGEAAARAMG